MASLNQVTLIGNLGADPELTFAKGNKTQVCKLRVATERWQGKDKDVETDWHQVVVFGEAAEACNEYLHKGAMVAVIGSIQYREYEGKWYTSIVASTVKFLKTDKNKAQESHTAKAPHKKQRWTDKPAPEKSPPEDDDIPF